MNGSVLKILAAILLIFLVFVLLNWGGFGWASVGGWGFPILGVVVLVVLIVWVAKGAPMP